MRAVLQRVTSASVSVEGQARATISAGYLILLGVHRDDTDADVTYVADKIVNLRVMEDDGGKMNLSIRDTGGSALVVSQFTLYGDTRKGRRPSFVEAAQPDHATALYEDLCRRIAAQGIPVQTGVFGAMMQVTLVNDGPVTILIDSAIRG